MTSSISNRLDTFARLNPEWRPWLTLLAEVLREMDAPVWAEAKPQPPSDRPVSAPLLDGVELIVNSRRTHDWVQCLLKTATTDQGLSVAAFGRLDATALLEAAIAQDQMRIQTLADLSDVESGILTTVAQLAVMPLLQASGRHLADQVPPTWSCGYCPMCGAWPALTELRGLERARRFRCARCGGDWAATWLQCPYCGESDHQRLGFLLPEGTEESRKVETCATCQGYVKTVATLQASPPYAIILEDLATVDLDVVALQRGYTRPERQGYAMTNCRIRIAD